MFWFFKIALHNFVFTELYIEDQREKKYIWAMGKPIKFF